MSEALYLLIGTVLGAIISTTGLLIREWLANKGNFKLELVRLYGRDRLEAYKYLLTFTGRIIDNCYPLADENSSYFIKIMETDFEKYVKLSYLYFTNEITQILDKFDEMYFSITKLRADLTEKDEDELDRFLDHDIFDLAQKLRELARKEAALTKMV